MSHERLRELEVLAARLEERMKDMKDDLQGLSNRIWAVVALVLFYVINQFLGLLTIGGVGP